MDKWFDGEFENVVEKLKKQFKRRLLSTTEINSIRNYLNKKYDDNIPLIDQNKG